MKIALLALVSLLLFVGCESTTAPSGGGSLSCEEKFEQALDRNVPYTEALGDYSQCLIDRGDRLSLQDVLSL